MNVLVALEHRFLKTPDGAAWTQTMFAYQFWQRYLEVFDGVKILARAKEVESPPDGWKRADGPGVGLIPLPYYVGPLQYALRAPAVLKVARNAVKPEDAVILRVPSRIAAAIYPLLVRTSHPYGVEVVGDPYDVFAPGAVRHPLRAFFRWRFSRELRHHCYHACGAAYVTKEALQRRYPTGPHSPATYYSDVELPSEAYADSGRREREAEALTIIFVGSLEQLYKAPDVLIMAFAECVRRGLKLRLEIIGDGRYRPSLEELAAHMGVADEVGFVGPLPGSLAVRHQLDRADLFVLPSRTEGLPRAMIEAMARGLPCLGTTVGGIPELLPGEDMVPPGDVEALVAKITEVVQDPARMARMSQRNITKAHEYEERILGGRRIGFYRYIMDETSCWQKRRSTKVSVSEEGR